MQDINELITDNLNIWASTVQKKKAVGRGSSKKIELYGVKKLRELILDLAVRGLLVPQDPSDETANVLLENIQLKKAELPKEKIVNVKNSDSAVSSSRSPFSIPSSWTWCRLPEITFFQEGPGIMAKDFRDIGVPLIRISGMHESTITLTGCNFLDKDMVEKKWNHFRLELDDIVLSSSASLGKVSKVAEPVVGSIAYTGLIRFQPYEGIHDNYLIKFLKSPEFARQINQNKTGLAIKHFGPTHLKKMIIPLPPKNEQRRIAKTVDELMALCDQLEQQQEESINAHQTLVKTLLDALVDSASHSQTTEGKTKFEQAWERIAEHFDTLFTTEDSIDQLKQCILQLAVMGKLVSQQAKNEPASALIKRLEAKVAPNQKKKSKNTLSHLTQKEIPYEIPQSWSWCRFQDVAKIASNLVKPNEFLDFIHLAPNNIEKGNGVLLPCRTVAEDKVKSANHRFYSGQIIYSKIRPNLSKAVVVNFDGLCSADMYPINPLIDTNYLHRYMLSKPFLSQAVKTDTRVAMPKINQTELNAIAVPVPPLAEQRRIAAKIDELVIFCDQLKTNLETANLTQLKLADAITKSTLT